MKKAFTIVELIVVIAVIAILASIAIVSYSWMQGNAMDTKIRSVVKTAGDGLALKEGQTGTRVATEGVFGSSTGMDSIVPKYLNTGYRDGLKSKNSASADNILRWYSCAHASNGFVVYASLNNPSSEDTNHFNKVRTDCNHTALVPTSGADVYNYAQLF